MDQLPKWWEALGQPTNLVFFLAMVGLAVVDIWTYRRDEGRNHKNFKGEIVGLGILGTFFGIMAGLLDFNVNDIAGSIPLLLEGLKTAFLTSVCGLGIALLLTIIQTFKKMRFAQPDDPVQESLQKIQGYLEESFDDIRGTNAKVVEEVTGLRKESREIQQSTQTVIKENLQSMNQALDSALAKLSEGASKQIIKALEDVIKDFNTNLTEQFGQNFKELNAACRKLLDWQENYKGSVESMETSLRAAAEAIGQCQSSLEAITKKHEQFAALTVQWGDLLERIDGATRAISAHIEGETGLLERANRVLSEADSQVKAIVTNLESSRSKVEDITEHVQRAFTSQAGQLKELGEEVSQVTKQTRENLAAALRALEDSLVSLTVKFQDSYGALLERLKELSGYVSGR